MLCVYMDIDDLSNRFQCLVQLNITLNTEGAKDSFMSKAFTAATCDNFKAVVHHQIVSTNLAYSKEKEELGRLNKGVR